MCELLILKSEETIPIQFALSYAKLLDEFGLAGFSWGIAWKQEKDDIHYYKSVDGIRHDKVAITGLNNIESKEYFVHLRRPSLMNSIAVYNAQPYVTDNKSIAFGHNGNFQHHNQYRPFFSEKLVGTSDSEVGFQYFLHEQMKGREPLEAIQATYEALSGKANMVVMRKQAPTIIFSGNVDNHLYSFQLGKIKCVSSSLHSHDDFVFRTIFPTATAIQPLPLFSTQLFE